MGMYDSIYLVSKCPYCGHEKEREFQTKDLECNLEVWRKGDHIDTDLEELECVADCINDPCKAWTIKEFGYFGGFGRAFYANVILDDGIITGELKIITDNS